MSHEAGDNENCCSYKRVRDDRAAKQQRRTVRVSGGISAATPSAMRETIEAEPTTIFIKARLRPCFFYVSPLARGCRRCGVIRATACSHWKAAHAQTAPPCQSGAPQASPDPKGRAGGVQSRAADSVKPCATCVSGSRAPLRGPGMTGCNARVSDAQIDLSDRSPHKREGPPGRAFHRTGPHRIGGPYCRPPFVQRAFSPRGIFRGVPSPRLRAKTSP